MKANLHTHSTWCDGKNSVPEMIEAAIARGFGLLGFSSHSALPIREESGSLFGTRLDAYAADVRKNAEKYKNQIKVLCGIEADFIPGMTTPDRSRYDRIKPDYVIGSIHYVVKPISRPVRVAVDHTPEILAEGIKRHFRGDARLYLEYYFAQLRDMVTKCDFDIVGHADLPRKFNDKLHYFDENDAWYVAELERTADVIAMSGKIVEINTGGISRGWIDDAYPSAAFRTMLRERGVKFILSSDAHSVEGIDCAFDRFASEVEC